MIWKEPFAKGEELVLATANNDMPHANIVISLGLHDGKLLVADCQMTTTRKNLERNKDVCVIGGYYRLKGTAELFTSGEHYDRCVEESEGYDINQAALITIKEVFDLDNGEPIIPN